PFHLDVLILPINGNKPERRVAGNLNSAEAIKLAQLTKSKMLIPCHYDMFTFNTVDPTLFETLAQQEKIPYTILQCGERYSN
ncbi:MAG: MBL fold metallo-hydrolase, partial [Bacteroidota bacterium]